MCTITLTRYSLSVDILVLFFEYFLRTHHLSQQTEETKKRKEKKYATHSQHTNTYIYFIYRFISIFLYANKIERERESGRRKKHVHQLKMKIFPFVGCVGHNFAKDKRRDKWLNGGIDFFQIRISSELRVRTPFAMAFIAKAFCVTYFAQNSKINDSIFHFVTSLPANTVRIWHICV